MDGSVPAQTELIKSNVFMRTLKRIKNAEIHKFGGPIKKSAKRQSNNLKSIKKLKNVSYGGLTCLPGI